MDKSRIYKILSGVLSVFSIISTGLAIYSIYLLAKIETFYRIMFSLLLILILTTLVYSLLESIKTQKNKKLIITSALSVILVVVTTIMSLVILQVYGKLDKMNQKDLLYKTAIISYEEQGKLDTIKDKKIGIIEDKEDIEGNILPNEVIEKYKLKDKNEIIEYSDTITLISALAKNEVDIIFISSNYKPKFEKVEGIDKNREIHEIATYEKKYKKSEIEGDHTTPTAKVTEPFTVLLLGADSDDTSFNGDTIMLVTFDPNTLNATMFSIPRDTYVTMACGGNQTKITHAAWGGVKCMVRTVENFTKIDVDYYVKINFNGLIDLVNALGGITVDVPIDFCESNADRWQGPEYEICLNKGVQRLTGEQALALARHRKTLPLGDFQRGQHQQLVVEGILNELKTIRTVKDFYNILDILSTNLDTSMSPEDILSFYNVGKNILLKDEDVKINITKTFLRGYDLYIYEGNGYTYTFQNFQGSLDDIVKAMKINLGQMTKEEIKTFSFDINSPYEKKIIGDEYYNEPRKQLIPNFSAYSLSEAQSWASRNGFNIAINTVETNSYNDGQIINQSVHEGVLITKAPKTITLDVAKKGGTTSGEPEKPTTPEPDEPSVPGTPTDPEEPTDPTTPDPDEPANPDAPTGGDEGGENGEEEINEAN